MRISAAFPSEYLRVADLNGREVRLVIDEVKIEEIGKERDNRPVLYFLKTDKGLILNKTNANAIAVAYGDDTDDWRGAEIVLFEAQIEYAGKVGPAIRVKIPPRRVSKGPEVTSGKAARQPDAQTGKYDELDDTDIPF